MSEKDPVIGISPTEKLAGKPRKTLRRWWEKNKFPKPTKFNGRLYWRTSAILKWKTETFGEAILFDTVSEEDAA